MTSIEIGTLVAFTSLLAFVGGLGSAIAIVLAMLGGRGKGRH